jgi:hypothetical protein
MMRHRIVQRDLAETRHPLANPTLRHHLRSCRLQPRLPSAIAEASGLTEAQSSQQNRNEP